MELRHLRYFVRVAEERHFGRAAQELGISQPPLSQQIRALETELGVALFARTSRRVELTEAGRLFLPEARAVLVQAAHAIDVVQRVQNGELGELSIAFSGSVPFIPAVADTLANFRRDHPAVHLSLSEFSREVQVEALLDRRIDIGFIRSIGTTNLPTGLVATQLLEERLIVAMRQDHPLAGRSAALRITDLLDVSIVLYRQVAGSGFNDDLFALFRRHDQHFRIAQEVGGLATLLGVVAAGLGVTIIAESLAAIHADQVVYRLLDETDAISRLWLVHRRQLARIERNFVEPLLRSPLSGGRRSSAGQSSDLRVDDQPATVALGERV